jgi:serine/threonine protein kinase
VHASGIVHRDVKPSNILLDTTGRVYLADFGISRLVDATRLTATGSAIGTAAYMAPEQVRGAAVGPAADLYALGLVLLECLTGRTEYTGTSFEVAVARLSRSPHIPADLPAGLADALHAMTATEPQDRPDAVGCITALRHTQPGFTENPRQGGSTKTMPASPGAATAAGTSPTGLGVLRQATDRAAREWIAAVRHRDPSRLFAHGWALFVTAAAVFAVGLLVTYSAGDETTPPAPQQPKSTIQPGPQRLPQDLQELEGAVQP